jgi:hypothetical protein
MECGSSSTVPALQELSPEFKPQSHQKICKYNEFHKEIICFTILLQRRERKWSYFGAKLVKDREKEDQGKEEVMRHI